MKNKKFVFSNQVTDVTCKLLGIVDHPVIDPPTDEFLEMLNHFDPSFCGPTIPLKNLLRSQASNSNKVRLVEKLTYF